MPLPSRRSVAPSLFHRGRGQCPEVGEDLRRLRLINHAPGKEEKEYKMDELIDYENIFTPQGLLG